MNEHCVLSLSIYCLTYIKSNIVYFINAIIISSSCIDVYNFQWSIIQFLSASIFALPTFGCCWCCCSALAHSRFTYHHMKYSLRYRVYTFSSTYNFPSHCSSAEIIYSCPFRQRCACLWWCWMLRKANLYYTYIETCVYDFKYIECVYACP